MAYSALVIKVEGRHTGRRRYRKSWVGKVILQMEFETTIKHALAPWISNPGKPIWRDATPAEAGINCVFPESSPSFMHIIDGNVVEITERSNVVDLTKRNL